MNEFIHTFSAVTYLTGEQKDVFASAYGKDVFFNNKIGKTVFSTYAKNGFRVLIEFCTSEEKRYGFSKRIGQNEKRNRDGGILSHC